MTPADAAEVLATSVAQIMALIRSGELRAIQIGGRGQWRIEDSQLQAYIDRQYAKFDGRQRDSTPAEQHQDVEAD